MQATVGYVDAWKTPDSLTWALGSGAHRPVTSQEITGHFTLAPATKETIYMGLWTGGMRSILVSFTQNGSSPNLDVVNSVPNPIAMLLLKEADMVDRIRDSLLARYARHLVNGDSLFRGYPANRPVGIDSLALIRTAVQYALSKRAPFSALAAKWSLGFDSVGLRQLVKDLVDQKLAGDSDLVRAFPPYPVRVARPITVGDLESSASTPILGKFQGDSGLSRYGIKVLQRAIEKTGLFTFPSNPPASPPRSSSRSTPAA